LKLRIGNILFDRSIVNQSHASIIQRDLLFLDEEASSKGGEFKESFGFDQKEITKLRIGNILFDRSIVNQSHASIIQ